MLSEHLSGTESLSKRSLSTEVIRAIAAEEGVDALELSPPLYDVIDPDALDALFHNTSGRIAFEYRGYTVTVTSEGTVTTEPSSLL